MLRRNNRTRVVAVLGYPLDYNLTAPLLNAGFEAAGLDVTCVPFEVEPDRLPEAIKSLRTLRFVGANIAMPYKESVLPHLDKLGMTAGLVGLADTIGLEGRALVGHNSDYHAFLYTYREATSSSPKGKHALVMGAGGTAGAISAALLKEGAASLRISNRTRQRADTLVTRLRLQFPQADVSAVPWERAPVSAALRDCDLLVKAMPGEAQSPRGPLFNERDFHSALTVFDASYATTTELLMNARRAGATPIAGNKMLLWHAIMSFRLWTLQEAPRAAMERALASMLGLSAPTPVSMS